MNPTVILSFGACCLAVCFAPQARAQNTVSGTSTSSGIASGNRNLIFNASYSFIGGGFTNVLVSGANFSTIGGGFSNAIIGGSIFATVAGGSFNLINTNATNATLAEDSATGSQAKELSASSVVASGTWSSRTPSSPP